MDKLLFNFRVEESFLIITQNTESVTDWYIWPYKNGNFMWHKISKIRSIDSWKTKRKYW